ncbi:transcriptional regulator [Kribbella soli]|uniref:Transcriptional regulator n=1 Tax=Kribbella soli TaxID=1124743 RepID=A0A4R0HDF9_9ACTN|nr:transcriptional regulator [Kribbella soli]TCC07624.1 transcriptional regulator [Kribbella soli]
MTKDYGRPANADENRALVKSRLDELVDGNGPRETLTVDWRGTPKHLDVIQMPVGNLHFNPATHRVRAQRSYDAHRDELLEVDPWSSGSQAYLDSLLKAQPSDPSRRDPEFNELAESLSEYGQSEPGLVTHDGVLVNGNTRRAALLEIHGPNHPMRVAVLPASCDWQDIADIELSLQLRKEHRRDYSYINRLLAVQELVDAGAPLATIAATFRTTAARCRQDQWVLSCIEAMIARSDVDGARLSLISFEEHQEKLRELHRAYEKLQATNPEKAELLLESRMTAIILGFSKTDVRLIEPGFENQYLSAVLPADGAPKAAGGGVVIPGLGRSVKQESRSLVKAKALTDAALRARMVTSGVPDAVQSDSGPDLAKLRSAMDSAIERAGRDSRVRKRKQAAPKRLLDATADVNECVTDLAQSRATQSLDEEAFDDALLDLRKSLEALARETRKTVKDPGDGASWLLEEFGKGF